MQKKTKKNEIVYTGNELVTFEIGRGGMSHNPGYLRFENTDRDIFFEQENYIFEKTRNKKGRFCKKYLTDVDGNTLMDALEYSDALQSGCGKLDFDGGYDTIYTKLLAECDNKEIQKIIESESWDKDYLITYFIENKMVSDTFIRNYLYNKNNEIINK